MIAIQQTSEGGYITGGRSLSNISGDKTENSMGGEDYWVVKLDSAGNIEWQNTIGGDTLDYFGSLQQTFDGGYIIGGYSSSHISGDKTEDHIGYPVTNDYWVLKLDASGNIQWQNTIGGFYDDWLFSVLQCADGKYLCGGWSISNISADKTENSKGAMDYWIVKLSGKYNAITGKLFIDTNSNGGQDAGEPAVIHKTVTEISTGRFAFSEQNGNYSVSVLDSGNFSVSPASINYYNTVPATHNTYFSNLHQIDSLNEFAFQPAGVFNDLCVMLTLLDGCSPGFDAHYMITFENVGTTVLSPSIIFNVDTNLTFVMASPAAVSVTTDSIVWNFGAIAPFQTENILITLNINGTTPLGTLINSDVRIEPLTGDANPMCNYDSSQTLTTGSFDPNAILVDRDTVLTTELSIPPYLEYIIYFQNTGNDTAFNVNVANSVSDKLDISNFEFVSSSHPMNITYSAYARMFTFSFDNILLPDSSTNEPASHGFIRYRIKPLNTLIAGDSINNTAYIYFDFNLPMQTNTAITEIVLPTSVNEWAVCNGQLTIFPNPAKNELTVSSKQFKDKSEIKVFDLFGRIIFQSPIKNQQTSITLDVSGFSKGVYFVEVISPLLGRGSRYLSGGGEAARAKFMKE